VCNHGLTSGSQSTDYNFRYSITSFKYYTNTQHLPFIQTFLEPKFNMTTNPKISTTWELFIYVTIKNHKTTHEINGWWKFKIVKYRTWNYNRIMTTDPWKYTKIINILPFISTELQFFYKPEVCSTGKYDWRKINKMTYLSGNKTYYSIFINRKKVRGWKPDIVSKVLKPEVIP
jgi:hypothetical protein